MDARGPTASHVLRKTIVARMVELSGIVSPVEWLGSHGKFSVSGFRELVTGGAGGLLLLLPPGLQDNLEVDAKEHILALEEELLNAELDIPIYFAEETEELLELHATLTSEGEVRISKLCYRGLKIVFPGQRGSDLCHGSLAPECFQFWLPTGCYCSYPSTSQRPGCR